MKCKKTGEPVLYADCQECGDRNACRQDPRPWFALLVVGSRSISDYSRVREKIDRLIGPIRDRYRFIIVSGGARGVDSLAERYAEENGFAFRLMPADWNRYGKAAGYIRNRKMHEYISGYAHRGVTAFWDGKSKGTLQSVQLARQYGNPLRFIKMGEAPGGQNQKSGRNQNFRIEGRIGREVNNEYENLLREQQTDTL